MSSTIFCTFAREDFANFAAGRLTQEVTGIQSIRRVKPKEQQTDGSPVSGVTLASWGTAESLAVASVSDGASSFAPDPVTLKIICDSASRDRVTALLADMQGYNTVIS